jgi:DNA replication protein DnaC
VSEANVETEDEEIPEEWRKRDAEIREIQAAEAAEKERHRTAEFEKLKGEIGIPSKFLALVNGRMDPTEAMAEVKKGGFDILVLSGDVGRGKTVAAVWWLLQAIRERRRPLFVTAAKLSRWERYDGAEMDKLLGASRLVIDDLGNEYNDAKGNFLTLLDELVADRVANKRPTVITTNLTAEAFLGEGDQPGRYGVRVRDRIKESGRFQEFAGASFRGGGQQLGLLPAANGVHR